MAAPDPEVVAAFRELGFDTTDALLLTVAGADPQVVAWRLEQGCTKEQAVRIYS